MKTDKRKKRIQRQRRIRSKTIGTEYRPRLSVFRSAKHVFLQLVDDKKKRTILSFSDKKEIQGEKTKTEKAYIAGKKLAELAKKKGVKKVVFDKGGYSYHGRIKAAAEGAREGGLEF